MKTIVHIDQHTIRDNRKTGKRTPCITVKNGRSNIRATEVEITGPCKLVYSPAAPLDCGAVLWLETLGEVIPVGPTMTAKEARKVATRPQTCEV